MKLINIGFGSMLSAARVLAMVEPDSAPIKRIVQGCKEKGTLIDATHGRKSKAVILTDTDLCLLSYLQPETLRSRITGEEEPEEADK